MCRDVHVAKPPDVSKRRGSAKIYIGLPRVWFPDGVGDINNRILYNFAHEVCYCSKVVWWFLESNDILVEKSVGVMSLFRHILSLCGFSCYYLFSITSKNIQLNDSCVLSEKDMRWPPAFTTYRHKVSRSEKIKCWAVHLQLLNVSCKPAATWRNLDIRHVIYPESPEDQIRDHVDRGNAMQPGSRN